MSHQGDDASTSGVCTIEKGGLAIASFALNLIRAGHGRLTPYKDSSLIWHRSGTMSSRSGFRIFPSPVVATEIDLSRPQLSTYERRSTELVGVEFRPKTPPARLEPSAFTRSHSPSHALSEQRTHQRKRSSVPDLRDIFRRSNKSNLPVKPALALCIPSSTYSASSHSETASTMRSTPATSYTDTPATEYSALSSAGSQKTPASAYPPRSHSLRSGSSACSKTNFSKRLPIIPASPADCRDNKSIFPQYDYTKPLSQQTYQPPITGLAYSEKKTAQAPPSALKRKDSAVVLQQGYESLPEPDNDDIAKLWSASTRLGTCGGRKTHLSLHYTAGTTYSIGSASDTLFKAKIERAASKDSVSKISLSKLNPQTHEGHVLANMELPVRSRSQAHYSTDNTHIFPHQAAVDALTAASNSPQAAEIARFDPGATSRAAETLAKEAVNDAHRCYTSELVRTTRRHDSTSRADYKLQHSLAGDMTITVVRSSAGPYAAPTRMRVALHHPTASQNAIAEESMVVLCADLARNACVIDLPSILSLDADYMLDTALAAVFAVVTMEQEDIVPVETMTFAAPPTKAINDKVKRPRMKLTKSEKPKDNKAKSGLWPLRRTGVIELDEKVDDLPPFAKTAVAAVELGLHGAFWLLEKGARTLDDKGRGRL